MFHLLRYFGSFKKHINFTNTQMSTIFNSEKSIFIKQLKVLLVSLSKSTNTDTLKVIVKFLKFT